MNAAVRPTGSQRVSYRSRAAFVVAFAVCAAFYVWTARSDNLSWHWGREQTDHYNLLVDGMIAGRLSLGLEVPPELLRVTDPYDPDQRPPGIALHDASLYRGKYYIYFGVVPAVLLLLPFRLVTGVDLPVGAGVLTFVLLGYAAALATLGQLRRQFFPQAGPILTWFAATVMGFASCAAILLRRSSMYDLAIASGYAFAMAGIFALHRAIFVPGRRLGWCAASSFCWGCAIGSRPIYLLAPACLALALLLWLRTREEGGAPLVSRRKLVFASAMPLLAIGALLGLYNYLRFGDPTEFGVRYILSGVYESKIEHFSLRYVAWNLYAYFCAPLEWSRYFPFVHPAPISLPLPRQHFGMDIPFGLLVNVPFLWLSLFAFLRPRASAGSLRAWRVGVVIIAWVGLSVCSFLVFFYAAMVRYLGDFTPALALLAAIGALSLTDRLHVRGNRWRVWLTRGSVTVLGVTSVLVVTLFSIRVYDRMRQFNPSGFESVARVANAPVHWFERWQDLEFGPVTLALTFAERGAATAEELLSTGVGQNRDRVLVYYPDDQHVQFGFEHTGAPVMRTPPLAVDRNAPHVVRISLGSLYPPASYPLFRDWPSEMVAALLRRVRVELDGTVVLDRYQRFYPASPSSLVVAGAGAGNRFTGAITQLRRDGLDGAYAHARAIVESIPQQTLIRPTADGTLRFLVQLPPLAAGARRCVVASGETGRGDILFIEFLGDGRLRFMLDHWGRRPYVSSPVGYIPGREYRMEIRHPVYGGQAGGGRRAGEGLLSVALDGTQVWELEPLLYPVEREDIFVGYNPIGGSSGAQPLLEMMRPEPQEAAR